VIERFLGETQAGKITGMLLDEGVVNFEKLLTDIIYFNEKAYEADSMLKQSQPP
jgi:hypothetical protein